MPQRPHPQLKGALEVLQVQRKINQRPFYHKYTQEVMALCCPQQYMPLPSISPNTSLVKWLVLCSFLFPPTPPASSSLLFSQSPVLARIHGPPFALQFDLTGSILYRWVQTLHKNTCAHLQINMQMHHTMLQTVGRG